MANRKRLTQNLSEQKQRLKSGIGELLDMPREIILDLPKIIIIGTCQLSIENHRGVVEYSERQICVNTSAGLVKVSGQKLKIKNIYVEDLYIEGNIASVALEEVQEEG